MQQVLSERDEMGKVIPDNPSYAGTTKVTKGGGAVCYYPNEVKALTYPQFISNAKGKPKRRGDKKY